MRRASRIETALVLAALLTACDDSSGSSTPTAPAELTADASAFWLGEITLDAAWPSGHCVVDGVLADPSEKTHDLKLDSSPPVSGQFWARLYTSDRSSDDFYRNPYQGFLPSQAYTGVIEPSGTLHLSRSIQREEHLGQSIEVTNYCTDAWARTNGAMVGEISPDGSRLRGELVENFRSLHDGSSFTVHWRIDLARII